MKPAKPLMAALTLLCLPATAQVMERTVWAEVTRVSPITRTVTEPATADCPQAPPRDAGLTEILNWDLNPACYPSTRVHTTGYQVHYQWDGRNYSLRMTNHPGQRIPLRLRLR